MNFREFKEKVDRHGIKAVAKELNVHRSTIYRCLKEKRVPNPPTKRKGTVKPIWDHIDPERLYNVVGGMAADFAFVNRLGYIGEEEVRDMLLDFAFSLDLEDKRMPWRYLARAMKRKCWDFLKRYDHQHRSRAPSHGAISEDSKLYLIREIL